MIQKSENSFVDNLNIVWTIVVKDIVDALKNKVIIGMIFSLSIILLMPRMLPLIFEQPDDTALPVYVSGNSPILSDFQNITEIDIQLVKSQEEFTAVLCRSLFPQIGLYIPAEFSQTIVSATEYEFQGFSCWNKRHAVSDIKPGLEEALTRALGHPLDIQLDGNYVYPSSMSVFSMSLATINAVLMILMIGISLIPNLLFEEKESKTMQALLVSPASISQVVLGKALAGAFYVLVTAGIIFWISWTDIVHWGLVAAFVTGGGLFSVALGLILGSFFDKQQDMVGWLMVILLFLLGSILVRMFSVDLPTWITAFLPFIPSVALAEICQAAFSDTYSTPEILTNLGIILAVSLPIYALVIWKIRRSDR